MSIKLGKWYNYEYIFIGIVFNEIHVPKKSPSIKNRIKTAYNTAIKKKSFRIKHNKGMRKRLFSANERGNNENQSQNASVHNLHSNKFTKAREKKITPKLPPLGKFLNYNMKNKIEDGMIELFFLNMY